MEAIAQVAVPAWGSTRTPVLAIDGDTWTVQDPRDPSRQRDLKRAALNLLTLCPTRVGLVARRAGVVRRTPPIPVDVQGAEWREARATRLAQIHVCIDKGWRVSADGTWSGREDIRDF